MAKMATLIASSAAFILAIIKLGVGIAGGSVAVLASAMDSLLDGVMSIFNFFALQQSERPANQRFNYGYGKIQSLAALFEGCVIGISGIYILYKSIQKIFSPEPITQFAQSVGVMVFSLCVSAGLVVFLALMVKKSKNEVLQADLLHYKADLLSNAGVLVSLGLIALTQWESIDGILGLMVALYVIYSAFKVAKQGVCNLLDHSIDEALARQIQAVLQESTITSFHGLKSRISGNTLFLEVHIVFDEQISLLEAHEISEGIEERLRKIETRLEWVILSHLDPYDDSALDELTS